MPEPTIAPKRMSREDRRASLLDAAVDVLAAGTTMTFESIAEGAGVSPTLPYKYFDSVDEIANELYRRIVGAVDEHTDTILADTALSFDDKVRATLHLWCDTLRDQGMLLFRLSDDVAHPSLSGAIDERRERAVDVWAVAIAAEFTVTADDARLLGASLTAGSTAVLRRWIRDHLDRVDTIERFVVMNRGQIDALIAHHPPTA